MTAHHLANGATDKSLGTFAITTSAGDVVGNVTYSRVEEFKYGPVSYTFATDPAPPAAAKQSVIDCVATTFGPNADSTSYVRKYLPSKAATAVSTAPSDPRWAAMLRCFSAHGLAINSGASTPAMVVVGRIGIAAYKLGGFPMKAGPVSYGFDYSSTSPAAKAFAGCVTASFG